MFGARNFFLTAARAVGDSLWNYVTALFSTTSTNGAQNNTFLDSSSNNFTITRNGNTTQGSFSPYEPEGYWSVYNSGGANFLSLASNSQTAPQSNNFTIEFWAFLLDGASNSLQAFYTNYTVFNTAGSIYFGKHTTYGGAVSVWISSYSTGGALLVEASQPPTNQWVHYALVRNGNTFSLYRNGTLSASSTAFTGAATLSSNPNYLFINGDGGAYPTPGYLSNFRIVNGTAVYTANFTPPTTPLTAITNTALLTCQSNRFKDNSANNLTITVNNSPSIQAFSPLGNTTPYSTAAVGGSGYFDGSGDSLTLSQATALSLGTGDFSVEAWVYPTANPASFWSIIDARGSVAAIPWAAGLRLVSGALRGTFYNGADIQGSINVPLNAWTHIVFSRVGSTLRSFVNGVLDINTTMTTNLTIAGTQYIGAIVDGQFNTGYMTDVRIVKGSGVTSVTVPTSPLTAITNTQLLLNSTNAGIFDAAAANDFETVGNAQVSTTQAKFGPTSMYFDGSGDYLINRASPNAQLPGNFTVEAWIYPLATGTGAIFDTRSTDSSATGFYFGLYTASNTLLFYTSGAVTISGGTAPVNTWTHIALVRAGSTVTMYANGQAVGTATTSANFSDGNEFVGSSTPVSGSSANSFNGYIDELRITKGYARYWYNNFPVPTAAFQVQYAPEVPSPNDPLFDYVTMLLPGNGTNGAQNNTFLDSSANNYTITRNGNSTQGAFTPYGPNWSNYLDGDGDNLTLADNAAFEFGSGSFSIDIWINPFAMKGYQGILGKTDSGGDQRGWILYFETNNQIYFQYGNGSWVLSNNSFGTVPVNNWTHLAVTRDTSNVWRLFKNGILVNSTTNSGTINDSNSLLYIGKWPFFPGYSNTQDFGGYMSNARIVKGGMPTLFNTAVTAIGTQVFTPPTAPYTGTESLTAGSVSLLTCQSNRFIDNSSNAFAITVNGTPGTQRFSPFNPPAAYSAATNGGSGYFDGSGDKLLVATNSNMTLGTNDFTVELWAYPLALNGSRCFTTQADPSFDQNGYWIGSNGTGLYWLVGNGTWAILSTVGTLTLNAWNHIALTRSGTTFRAFINGVLVDTQTSSVSLTNANNNVSIGGRDAGAVQYSNSYISGYRVLNGTCLYTATFTPPTTPPTVITNTQLLTNFTNAGVIDNAMMNDLETVGTAQVSTTQSKFGGGSMFFNGSGSYLVGASTPQIGLGSSDFTIEMWVYLTANFDGTGQGVVTAAYNTNFAVIGVNGGGGNRIDFYVANVLLGTGTNYISLNTWTHLAFTRASGTTRIFFNGNQVASSTSQTGTGAAAPIFVGTLSHDTPRVMTGYIDDLRITKGIARYVQPFTPPTQAFQTQ